jgi:hypothetical protein
MALGRKHFFVKKTIPEIFQSFNKAFGSGFADPDDLLDAIKQEILFDSTKRSPQVTLDWLNENLKAVNSALRSQENPNAELNDDEYRLIILKGLDNVAKKTTFWQKVYGELKEKKFKKETQSVIDIDLMLIKRWNIHSSPETVLEHTVRERLMPLRSGNGNQFAGNAQHNAKPHRRQNQNKKCDNCSIEVNGRLSVQNSHQTRSCFYGNQPGWERQILQKKMEINPVNNISMILVQPQEAL